MTVPNKTTELREKIDIQVFEMLGITKALKKDSWDYKTQVDTALNEIMRLIEKTVLDVIGEDTLNIPDNDPGWLRMQNQLKASQRDHLHKIVKGRNGN